MKNNMHIWVTDGSYDRKKAKELSGVGWIIFCTKTELQLKGTLWEKLNTASLFWEEILGLCALHLFAQAVAEFYKVEQWSATPCCNNRPILKLSSHHRRHIRPSAKCADIQQNLRTIKQTFTGSFQYFHIYGHMDKYLKWEQVSLVQQLNCVCNTLAKRAITTATLQGYHSRQSQFLPKKTWRW
jgi:hypothetical protein